MRYVNHATTWHVVGIVESHFRSRVTQPVEADRLWAASGRAMPSLNLTPAMGLTAAARNARSALGLPDAGPFASGPGAQVSPRAIFNRLSDGFSSLVRNVVGQVR